MRVGLKDLFKPKLEYEPERPPLPPDPVDLDRMLVAELEHFGVDLERPRDTRFFLYFDHDTDAEAAADAIRGDGYEALIEETEAERGEPWRIVAWRDMVVDDDAIADARRAFGRIAVANWGSFGGWEAAASD